MLRNDPGNSKHARSRPAGFNTGAKAALARVVQIRHFLDLAAASSQGRGPSALSFRKGRLLRHARKTKPITTTKWPPIAAAMELLSHRATKTRNRNLHPRFVK